MFRGGGDGLRRSDGKGGGGEEGHQEEEVGVGGDVEIEVDETVNEEAATAGKSGEAERGDEGELRILQRAQSGDQENADKPCAANPSENSGFGEGFEIVIVNVVDDFSVVQRFIGRIDDLRGAEPGAENGMIEEDAPRAVSHGGALSFFYLHRLQAAEAGENFADADPGNKRKSGENDDAAGQEMFAAGAAEEDDGEKKKQFDGETDDAAARGGENDGNDGHQSKETDHDAAFLAYFAKRKRHKRDGNGELRESGEMIAIDVRTEWDSAVTHFAKPIEFPVEREVLENSEAADEKSHQHGEPEKFAPVLHGAESLRGEKNQNDVCKQQLEFNSRGEERRGAMEEDLREDDTGKREKRRENGRQSDFFFLIQNEKHRPDEKQNSGGCFENRDGPFLDAAVRENAKREESADRDAQEFHRFVCSAATGTNETSSIQAVPAISPSGKSL